MRARAPAALLALALLFACLKGRSPTEAGANSVRFALSTQVSGGGTALHITVAYIDQPDVPVTLLDKRVTVGAGTANVPLTIDLTRCLADPNHRSAGTTCDLTATVVLEQNGTPVDSVTIGPLTVTPGQVVHQSTSVTAVGRVVVYPKSAQLTVGAITVLHDSVIGANGVYLPNALVTWASRDTSIAKVNQNGAVTGAGTGTTVVTATAGAQSDSATIVVTATGGGGGIHAGIPAVSFSAPQNSTIPLNAYVPITSTDTTVVSGLAATVAYGAGANNWLSANVSDSSFGQAVVKHGTGTLSLGRLKFNTRPLSRAERQPAARPAAAVNVTTPATLDIVPNTTNLPVGTYTATITITGNGGRSTTVGASYTISAAAGPTLSLVPSTLTFDEYAFGSTTPAAQTSTATNAGTGSLGTINVVPGAPAWLTASANGTTITVQPNTTTAFDSVGAHTGTISVQASLASNSPQTLTVVLNTWVTFTKIATGYNETCGVTTAGSIFCWGSNSVGQLGPNAATGTAIPAPLEVPLSGAASPAVDVGVGLNFACALLANGQVYCWGDNTHGQLGTGDPNGQNSTPRLVPNSAYSAISVGSIDVCAIESAAPGYVDCWGDNQFGQLGTGTFGGTQTTPVNMGFIAIAVTVGGGHTCALNSNKQPFCWGSNSYGELGYSTQTAVATPGVVNVSPQGLPIQSISAGGTHTCAIDINGTGYCWGNNSVGQLGNDSAGAAPDTVVRPIAGGLTFNSIYAGFLSTCGVATTGGYCWGDNSTGELGQNTSGGNNPVPTLVAGLSGSGITAQFANSVEDTFGCYVGPPTVFCYGLNSAGQLGIGGVGSSTGTPTSVVGEPAPSGVTPSRIVPRRPVVKRRK